MEFDKCRGCTTDDSGKQCQQQHLCLVSIDMLLPTYTAERVQPGLQTCIKRHQGQTVSDLSDTSVR